MQCHHLIFKSYSLWMSQQGTDLETLKHSSRLVHYCATPLLFDPVFRKQIQEEQIVQPPVKVRLSSDSKESYREGRLCLHELVSITLWLYIHNSTLIQVSIFKWWTLYCECLKFWYMCTRNGIAPATPRLQVGTEATALTQLTCCPADWRKNPGCLRFPAPSSSSTFSTCRAWASFWSRSGLSLQLAGSHHHIFCLQLLLCVSASE